MISAADGNIETFLEDNDAIDFVMPWVDGSDPVWRKEKEKWARSQPDWSGEESQTREETDDFEERYRDWDILQYWFRGVEKFCPWVHKIHFITWGHLPPWLVESHPKLHIVNHQDYIPQEYLPTFNSNSLESTLQGIHGLAEKFVYFNDDLFLLKPLSKEYFFRNGKPCDMLAFQPIIANPENPVMSFTYMNNMIVLARHFQKRQNVLEHPGKYFKIGYPPLYFFYNALEMLFPQYTGLYTVHGPSPFLKETFREVWAQEGQVLQETLSSKFRSKNDTSQYLFREWQKLKGNFTPVNLLRDFQYFELSHDNRKLIQTIERQKKKIICINDTGKAESFEAVKAELQDAFQSILPEKSSFER